MEKDSYVLATSSTMAVAIIATGITSGFSMLGFFGTDSGVGPGVVFMVWGVCLGLIVLFSGHETMQRLAHGKE